MLLFDSQEEIEDSKIIYERIAAFNLREDRFIGFNELSREVGAIKNLRYLEWLKYLLLIRGWISDTNNKIVPLHGFIGSHALDKSDAIFIQVIQKHRDYILESFEKYCSFRAFNGLSNHP